MNDKERILMAVIRNIIPTMKYRLESKPDDAVENCLGHPENLVKGDLVYANSTITPNDFMVGFVEGKSFEGVLIREIGSRRITNYSNESFTKINKKYLGYEILEGVQYQTYHKVLKAFEKYTSYKVMFKDISFQANLCRVQARERYAQETIFEVSFKYNSNTSIKSIGQLLESKSV